MLPEVHTAAVHIFVGKGVGDLRVTEGNGVFVGMLFTGIGGRCGNTDDAHSAVFQFEYFRILVI